MDQAQTYVERVPLPALAGRVRAVWVQRTGSQPYVQRNLPTGGVELQCSIGAVPRLMGPLTAASVQVLPAHTAVVGVRFWPGAASPLLGVPADELVDLTVRLDDGGLLRPEKVLFAAGRRGNTDGLGLEEAGVELDPKGRIVVDGRFETPAAGIYAAGDVIGPPALASASMEQGRVAVCNACGIPFKDAVDTLAPLGVYAIPELAMVGMTEEQARAGI